MNIIRTSVVLLTALVFYTGCKNTDNPHSSNSISVDSTSAQITEGENNGDNNVSPELVEEQKSGRVIQFENAEHFLSSMLYHSVNFHNYDNETITLKLMKSRFVPFEIREDFKPEYANLKCGSYNEGVGGLVQTIMMAYEYSEGKEPLVVMEELSGLSLKRKTDFSQPFLYINTEFVDWCWRNFYREPGAVSFSESSLNTIYDVVFKKFVRTLVVSHIELIGNGLENEKNWYRSSIIMEKAHAPALLPKRYVAPEKYKTEINEYYYPYASGFWLRREIDESGPVIWNYLRIIVLDYDYNWACKNLNWCDKG